MPEPLALKYRPKNFSDMIGQSLTASILQRMVEKHAVPHAVLFSGPSGTGKTSAARILGMQLNPEQADAIANDSSIDVVEIDSASNGGVADVRRTVETLRFAASPGARRVVIYDECHTITREGWNALLKPTEEDTGTTFVFVTTEPERIHDTVLSRLREFEFRRVTPYEICQRLVQIAKAEGINIEGKLLAHLSETAAGNVRRAIMSLDQVWQAEITTLEEYAALRGEVDRSTDLVRSMLTGDFALIHKELDAQLDTSGNPFRVTNELVLLLTDLLVYRAGGTTDHVGKAQQDRKELAYLLEQDRIVSAMKVIWDLKTRTKSSSSPASDVRLVVSLVADVLTRGRQASPAPVKSEQALVPAVEATSTPKKMSLSDMMKARS